MFEYTIETCTALLQINPRSARAYYLQGAAANELGHFDDGIIALSRCLDILSSSGGENSHMESEFALLNALMSLGFALEGKGKYEEALDAYNRALVLPAPPAVYGGIWSNK